MIPAAVEEEKKTFCGEEELTDVTADAKKNEEQIETVMSLAHFNQDITPFSPV